MSPGTRSGDGEANATQRPSAEMGPPQAAAAEALPLGVTLTSSVVPATRSRTKTSSEVYVGIATRFDAEVWKATKRPSRESWADPLFAFAWTPFESTLTRV